MPVVAYDALYSECFSILDTINDYVPKLNIIIVISNPNRQVISLIRSLNIKIISDSDSIYSFIKAMSMQNDEKYYSPFIMKKLNEATPPPLLLTKMERYVLKHLINGITPKAIAYWKGISVKTVCTHKKTLKNKSRTT